MKEGKKVEEGQKKERVASSMNGVYIVVGYTSTYMIVIHFETNEGSHFISRRRHNLRFYSSLFD